MSGPVARASAPAAAGARTREAAAPSSVRCFALLVAVKAALLLLGFGRTHRLVMRLSRGNAAAVAGCHPLVSSTADRVAMAAAFFPGRALCLEQSLALYLLLRRMGVQADLRFGVQAYPFAAHAWVEHGGEAVNEIREVLNAYLPFPTFPERLQ